MGHAVRNGVILALLAVGGGSRLTQADCAPFYDSLNSLGSITANGGVVSGTVTFGPAVNNYGAIWSSTGHATYAGRNFRTAAGSVSVWYKKTTAAASGGIWQIGTLGQPDSIGLFYINTSSLVFEMRHSDTQLTQIVIDNVLSQAAWTHIVAAWLEEGSGTHLWLFIDTVYRGYAWLPATLSHATAALQVGTTGYYGHGRGTSDELRWFDWNLNDSEVYAEYVYSSNRHRWQPNSKPVSTGPVQVMGKCLYVDGAPFTARGVGYAPTPVGYWPDYPIYTDLGILARDVPLLRAMNVNTVRTWAQPPDATLLDALYYNGGPPIYLIIGFWVPSSGIDYADPATIAYYETQFRSLVQQFKNHPGVLAWGIGNELNVTLSGQTLADWYVLANHLAQTAYGEEGAAYHPTIVVNGGMQGLGNVDYQSDDLSLNWVDMWGQNTYFGWDAHCFFDYYDRLSAKPLIFTEYGIDAWDNRAGTEYQAVQAAWDVHQYRQIRAACVGATVMAYSDEWWKADDPNSHDFGGYGTGYHPDGYSNEEWWGMVSVQDNGNAPDSVQPREVYYALAQEYAYSPGDYDTDRDVDLVDVAGLQACCGSAASGACGSAFDLDVDDVINFADLARFAQYLNGPARPRGCGN